MGWDKLFVVKPPQLKSSENMLAELFEVRAADVSDQTPCRPYAELCHANLAQQSIALEALWWSGQICFEPTLCLCAGYLGGCV